MSCFAGCFECFGFGGSERKTQMLAMKADISKLISDINCNPILIRLAWHDAGTYDQRIPSFPERGGANGAIIFATEMDMAANNGLFKAYRYLEPIKKKYPLISW